MTQKTAVYIDGYNFYYGRLRNTPFKWLDLVQLFDGLLKIQGGVPGIEAVKFFSAHALARFASHGNASVQAQQAYHRALQTLHPERFSIILGTHSMDNSGALIPVFREGMPYDRSDRVRVWKIEEKKTDVNLAMAMYRDAAKGLYDHVVLCSNDSDAEPVLQALREDFAQVLIGVVTPVPPPDLGKGASRGVSSSLSRHAHWTRRYILDSELAAAQLPLRIPTKKKPIDKPPHW